MHIGMAGYLIWKDDTETELLGFAMSNANAEFTAIGLDGTTKGTGYNVEIAGALLEPGE